MKKSLFMLIFAVLAFSMAACGSSKDSGSQISDDGDSSVSSETTTEASATTTEDFDQSTESSSAAGTSASTSSNSGNSGIGSSTTTKAPIPASEAFRQKSIWFGISDKRTFAKDSYIQAVFVFDGKGNQTVYSNVGQFKFSMINNDMSDDEIIEIVKKLEMEGRERKGVTEGPKTQPVNLQAFTDDSGNYVEEELLRYVADKSGLNGATINRELVVDSALQPIYDMQFAGYKNFKTRIKDTNHPGFALDTKGAAGVTVD